MCRIMWGEKMKKRVNVELEEALYNELKRMARERKMTMSAIIRNLIIQYLLQKEGGEHG
ncbi:MAG: hypothetical protein DRP01_08535 [Archaeoglobales archaeon]|nr:MAG: hypothetical protein DRP01_08535 [Archaeoglobales archaeon]